jgi:hypothetical protein
MDIDLESEDGYGDRRPLHEGSALATGQSSPRAKSEGDSEDSEGRPALIKRESSSKKTKTTEKKTSVPKGRAVKRKAPVKKQTKDETEEPEAHKPYPLEGKYKDEDDREQCVIGIRARLNLILTINCLSSIHSLLGLPEIEREEIIASRLEEHQKHLDRQQLAALYSRTNPGEAPPQDQDADEDAEGEEDMEMDMDIDQDSEEELGRGASRTYSCTVWS